MARRGHLINDSTLVRLRKNNGAGVSHKISHNVWVLFTANKKRASGGFPHYPLFAFSICVKCGFKCTLYFSL